MQALIDYEGWRKWRGFLDSPKPTSPAIDDVASPMQSGNHESATKPDSGSPLASRTTHLPKTRIKRPHLPEAAEILREDSWGSGSIDTEKTDFSTSPLSAPDVEVKAPEPTSAPADEQ